jgi:hypothetical protein
MKRVLALFTAFLLGLQPNIAVATEAADAAVEARVYLTDGTVLQGRLMDRASDLIIVRVDNEVFTFEPSQVKNIVTINSLGGAAPIVTALEFPYISFLGGTAAFSLLSWLQFDRASDKRADARLNADSGLAARARQLNDGADTAELLGWGAALLATGSLGVALFPRRTERRVFPALSLATGTPLLQVTCRF